MRATRQLGRLARLSARLAATKVFPQALLGEVIATLDQLRVFSA